MAQQSFGQRPSSCRGHSRKPSLASVPPLMGSASTSIEPGLASALPSGTPGGDADPVDCRQPPRNSARTAMIVAVRGSNALRSLLIRPPRWCSICYGVQGSGKQMASAVDASGGGGGLTGWQGVATLAFCSGVQDWKRLKYGGSRGTGGAIR